MRWTERQRAMLGEMGIRLWWPEETGAAVVEAPRAAEEVPNAPAARTQPRPAPGSAERREGREGAREGGRDSGREGGREGRRDAAGEAARESARDPTRVPGLAPADWLVVGEPLDPGDAQQAQLLDNMLRAIGVALVAPSRERRAVFVALDGADPAHDAQAPLAAALAAVAPRCVLAFGRAAAAALLGADAPIGGLRGRVHAHAGVPVVVTFSLAFLLRHPAEKAKAWADLCLAVSAS